MPLHFQRLTGQARDPMEPRRQPHHCCKADVQLYSNGAAGGVDGLDRTGGGHSSGDLDATVIEAVEFYADTRARYGGLHDGLLVKTRGML